MRVLALDAATEVCSVALISGALEISRRVEGSRGHADRILTLVDEVLSQAQTPLTSLDGIAASVGPGAFTGVRISIAVAQGLAFGAGLPVVAVTTLEALSFARLAGRPASDVALSCLDARMGEVYWASHVQDAVRGLKAIGGPQLCAPGMLRDALATLREGMDRRAHLLGAGRGFDAYPLLATLPGLELDAAARAALPDARDMARLGIMRLAAGEGADPAALEPVYLRDRVALSEAERAERRGAS